MSETPYESVTAQIIEALSRGVVPWRKPWKGGDALPCNAISKRPYRGINTLLLSLAPYRDHRWLTFKQALDRGGSVRKGEKSSIAVFWKSWQAEELDTETGETRSKSIPLMRLYRVFNVEQTDGTDLESPGYISSTTHERIETADQVVQGMPLPPSIQERGKSAWYKPSSDLVQVPPLAAFESADAFYATLFHELGHATGHEKRLNRKGVTGEIQFGSSGYSREELVAELTSAFCCAHTGLDNSLIESSASYVEGWLKVLKEDQKAVVIAASQAQRAADYIRGIEFA